MKKSNHSIFIFLLAIAGLTATAFIPVNNQKPKIAGTWDMSVQSSMGNGTPVMTLKQDNDTLISGTYNGQLGEAPVKGVIKGLDVMLEFNISGNIIQYTGVIDGDNMKGKVKFGSLGEGTFTGKRRESTK